MSTTVTPRKMMLITMIEVLDEEDIDIIEDEVQKTLSQFLEAYEPPFKHSISTSVIGAPVTA